MAQLHPSLYPDLARELDEPFPPAPCPICDDHMHAGDVAATRVYVDAARSYGIARALALTTSLDIAAALRREYGDFFLFCGWPYLQDVSENRNWREERIAGMARQAREGFVAMKFKIVPDRDGRRPAVWLDDPRVKPLFDFCEERGLVAQAHIAQPDVWFEKYYTPEAAGRKEEYFDQVERVLAEHPRLTYVGVHMGGWSEDLRCLQRMMDLYPGFHIDTSATKWTVRELSRQRDRAREFFIRNADRILFGSDLVVQKGVSPTYYTSRFRVQRTMWETDRRGRSMIKDADADEPPVIKGLALPADVLEKIYWGNTARVFHPA